MHLTKRQKEILTYLEGHIQSRGYAPSMEEIAEHFSYQSLATVHEHLTNLERKGYIRRSYNESRSIEVLPPRGTSAATEIPLLGKVAAGTPIEQATDQFKGVTAIALSQQDPVGLSKAIAKFTKANPDIFQFKVGIVEGKVVELRDVEAIASLPSKEELISKVMFLINCQAQRLVTVLSAVPRNLAIVIKQIGEQKA